MVINMAVFNIKKDLLRDLIDIASMKGKVQFKNNKGVTKPLFESYKMDVNPENRLEVLAIDTVRKTTIENIILNKNIQIEEDGVIIISDYDAIDTCLKSKSLKGDIKVSSMDNLIVLESEKDTYEIDQRQNQTIKVLMEKDSLKKLNDFKTYYKFDEDGSLNLHHPKAGIIPFPYRIKIKKEQLEKLSDDVINITKNNTTRIVYQNDKLYGLSGKGNANIKPTHELDFVNLGEDLIDLDYEFYSLQSIIPHLFDDIELFIRKIGAKDMIELYIKSEDKKTGMKILMLILSIVKKGSTPS